MKCPKWMKRADFVRIREMDVEDAEAALAKLYDAERERKRAWRLANKEKAAEMARNWRRNNPTKARAGYKRQREAIKADPERRAHYAEVRQAWLKRGGQKSYPKQRERERQYDADRYQRGKTKRLAQNKPGELRKLIQQLLPGYLIPAARMDVINSVMELALANRVRHDRLAEHVKACVTAYNRQFDHFKNVSIDAPIAGTDSLTRADLIDSEAFHF
ncbi:hypothetical protein DEA98_10090 [Brucella pseudogrignonensis]|uniref:Uncharacterized protein n=1 Tax=Brucella pseudogrignonensis TaxID=419475 RepID=A0A7Y3T6N4_9HYPH|nr:hypothetical protein [Brucella pseudogrignonensis]MCM0751547.1 hypothetical protein [Brucella pseudogrignonensis]NNV22056.1 hypothetical protein [Brucella pseudogrignonensis]